MSPLVIRHHSQCNLRMPGFEWGVMVSIKLLTFSDWVNGKYGITTVRPAILYSFNTLVEVLRGHQCS